VRLGSNTHRLEAAIDDQFHAVDESMWRPVRFPVGVQVRRLLAWRMKDAPKSALRTVRVRVLVYSSMALHPFICMDSLLFSWEIVLHRCHRCKWW
jgi:hypothetical protein